MGYTYIDLGIIAMTGQCRFTLADAMLGFHIVQWF